MTSDDVWVHRGTGFTGCGKTLSMKGTGFSPYTKEARTMGFSPGGEFLGRDMLKSIPSGPKGPIILFGLRTG
jgi:hypothetical protein